MISHRIEGGSRANRERRKKDYEHKVITESSVTKICRRDIVRGHDIHHRKQKLGSGSKRESLAQIQQAAQKLQRWQCAHRFANVEIRELKAIISLHLRWKMKLNIIFVRIK